MLKCCLGTMVTYLVIERARDCCMYVFLVLKWRSQLPVFYAAMGSVNSTDKNNGRHVPGKIVLKYSKPRVITYKMLCISRSVNDCSVMYACILTKFGLPHFSTLTKAQTQAMLWTSLVMGTKGLAFLSMWRGDNVSARLGLPSLKISTTVIMNVQNCPYLGSFLSVKTKIDAEIQHRHQVLVMFLVGCMTQPEIAQRNGHVAEHSLHDIVGSVKNLPVLLLICFSSTYLRQKGSNCKFT